ncbi:MAG TPA: NnrU family protein [Ramlibacter sp.]
MGALVLGLVLFLGLHSTRIFAEGWRTATMESFGEKEYKLLYSVLSIAGFVLLVWGYGLARHEPVILWNQPPVWTRHLASLLTMAAFVLLAAAYVPGNLVKAKLRHPMILGVKLWAFAHLLSNNTLADVVLFGSFLLWAVLDFRAARKRDRSLATVYTAGPMSRTVITVVAGVLAWAVFAMWAHRVLIGVSPLGV